MFFLRFISFFTMSLFVNFAMADVSESIPGCKDLHSVQALIRFVGTQQDFEELKSEIRLAYRALCSEFVGAQGSTIYYPNGKTATSYARTVGATWYYPNGKTITSYAGQKGATWYYPNGKTITSYMGNDGATWYYPNGSTMSSYYGQKGATWYYPNGKTITSYAGTRGATWYYPNGRTISSYFGQAGATWYYENGSQWMSNGPELSEDKLLYPHILLSRLFAQP